MNFFCGSMSTGPSGIYNQMTSHFPHAGNEFLLSMSSCIWSENSFYLHGKKQWLSLFWNTVRITPSQLVVALSVLPAVCRTWDIW
jgi:hypothetical protein